ncbi:MAG: peptidase S53, partial [Acidobacteriaceae bacterium]|nr:peptidase S53 [Acidobacteriaceae bacterium]
MKSALGAVPFLVISTLCFAAPDRVAKAIDSNVAISLKGSVPAKAQQKHDQGLADPAMQLGYVTMIMQPSRTQQADLERLLQQQQDPASRNYHKWLTPEQYATRFGLSSNDVGTISAWLRSQGFEIVQIARGRDWIAFSGTAALVENAFHTQLHYYDVDGERHFANATEISIPQALDGVVAGFFGLNDFSLKRMGIGRPTPTGMLPVIEHPLFDLGGSNFLAPDDLATIYDITPLYNAKIDGTG